MSAEIRAKILKRLEELGVDDELVTENIRDIVRGETVRKVFTKSGDDMELTRVEVISKPEDKLRGLVALDILSGGRYGVADHQLLPGRHNDTGNLLSRRKVVGVIDAEIISNKNGDGS